MQYEAITIVHSNKFMQYEAITIVHSNKFIQYEATTIVHSNKFIRVTMDFQAVNMHLKQMLWLETKIALAC